MLTIARLEGLVKMIRSQPKDAPDEGLPRIISVFLSSQEAEEVLIAAARKKAARDGKPAPEGTAVPVDIRNVGRLDDQSVAIYFALPPEPEEIPF